MTHQTLVTDVWTARIVQAYFGISSQTLIKWRNDGLPHKLVPGNKSPIFLYEPTKLKTWASDNKVDTYRDAAEKMHKEAVAEWRV